MLADFGVQHELYGCERGNMGKYGEVLHGEISCQALDELLDLPAGIRNCKSDSLNSLGPDGSNGYIATNQCKHVVGQHDADVSLILDI